MEDMERYGDYNEYEEDRPKSKNFISVFLKVLIAIVCITVVGVLGFRMIFFKYYPASIKDIYISDNLKAYYLSSGGKISAETQSLRAPYDNADTANFMCDNLILVRDAGELQVSVRFNEAALDAMEEASSFYELDPSDPEMLEFRLVDNYGFVYDELVYQHSEQHLFYTYYKLSFAGIEFNDYANDPSIPASYEWTYLDGKEYKTEIIETAGRKPEWIRLEIFVKGQKVTSNSVTGEREPFAFVPVYENNSVYSTFKPYEIGKSAMELLK